MRAAVVSLALVLVLAGCGPDVNRANFDRISEGMQEHQVRSILGAATETRRSAVKVEDTVFTSTQTKWRNHKGTIVVLFLNGEVRQKIFHEPGAEPLPAPRS